MPEITKSDPDQTFQAILTSAAQLPGVNIDRSKYLAGALKGHFSPEVIELAIETSPAAAGIRPEQLNAIADASIRYEAAKVTGLSALSGIPGGLAMAGTVPADLAQYFAHVLRISQKLSYLYGWESVFEADEEEMDDEAKNLLILFMGVMFGANGATDAIAKISQSAAKAAAKRISQKALTKGVVYPIVKQVAKYLGVQMTKEIFAKGVAKAIPVIGAVISGGVTLATYAPMSLKLKDYLASLEMADPDSFIEVEAEVVEIDEAFEE